MSNFYFAYGSNLNLKDLREFEKRNDINEKKSFIYDFNKEDKLELVQYLWGVAYADNVLDVNEERLIRRIASLINLKDIDVLKLKNKAKN